MKKAKYVDIVMPMNKVIECSNNFTKTTESCL